MRKFLCLALAGKIRLFLLLIASMLLICLNTFAGRVNDVPKEGKVFYTENISGTRAESEYGDWKLTSYVVNCFDEKRVKNKEYAWMMTADGETQLAVSLNYYGDDPEYKIASQEVEFYFCRDDVYDFFYDDEKELITDISRYVGSFTENTTNNSAMLTITAPSEMPFPYTGDVYYSYYVVIKVTFENGGTAAVAKNIGVSRRGVLLLHGLFANYDLEKDPKDRTFYQLEQYLLNSKNYFSAQVYCGDYHRTNTASFFNNTHVTNVVGTCLQNLSDNLFSYGIASTKYDMIGHSMGGILERLYNQEVDNKHTNKLITLNTPHFGSGWGNAAETIIANPIEALADYIDSKSDLPYVMTSVVKFLKGNYQAIFDLSLNSPEIQKLNSEKSEKLAGIPVCAVGTKVDWGALTVREGIANTIQDIEDTYLSIVFFLTGNGPDGDSSGSSLDGNKDQLINDNNGSDLVVSVESQRGGLSSNHSYIYWAWSTVNPLNSEGFHSGSPKWRRIHDKLLQLLKSTSKDEFSLKGFGTAPTANRSRTGSREGDIPTKYITEFEQPRESSFIIISVDEVKNEDYTHKIRLNHSADLERIVAFAKLSDNEAILDYGKDEMHFDLSGYDQEFTIYAIGRTDYNAFVADSIKVKLGESADIADVYTSNIQYSMNGKGLVIHNQDEPYEITVCDMLGRTLTSQKNNPSHTYTLPERSSVLIVRIKTKDDVQTFKVLPSTEISQ